MPNLPRVTAPSDDPTRWYVSVLLEHPGSGIRCGYNIGPLESWSKARDIAGKWEHEHGENTAHVSSRVPEAQDARRFNPGPPTRAVVQGE